MIHGFKNKLIQIRFTMKNNYLNSAYNVPCVPIILLKCILAVYVTANVRPLSINLVDGALIFVKKKLFTAARVVELNLTVPTFVISR